jgi:hypothetical protein
MAMAVSLGMVRVVLLLASRLSHPLARAQPQQVLLLRVLVVQTSNPASRQFVPTPPLPKLMLLLIMILSVFAFQVQAYPPAHFTMGTLAIFPLMWLMLASGANGQPPCAIASYVGV